MNITMSKHRLGCILALVQLYGEFLNFFKFLAVREKEIHQTPELEPDELEELLRIRVQMELALTKIATELSEKHGVCIPGPTRRTDDSFIFRITSELHYERLRRENPAIRSV